MILLKDAHCFAPHDLGIQDILLFEDRIALMGQGLSEWIPQQMCEHIESFEDCYAFPGFVDSHVHIIGGGGEGGFSTRTPEGSVQPFFEAGTTTVIGLLGTDGLTRDHRSLLAKARGFSEEGLLTYILTGSYRYPPSTLTGDLISDIMLVPEILGIGEIAVSDHRGSAISGSELQRLSLDARVGGMLSGKSGVVVIHMGDGNRGLEPLFEAVEDGTLPASQLLPTHIQRNNDTLTQGVRWIREKGGTIDFTACEDTAKTIAKMVAESIPIEQITVSTDGLGSIPKFNEKKEYVGMGIGGVDTLYSVFDSMVRYHQIPIEEALKPFTLNVSRFFGLEKLGVGKLQKKGYANILFVKKDSLQIHAVWAKGEKRHPIVT